MEDGDEKDETASEPDRTPEGYKSRYFVSLVGRSQRRTLHRGGECHRARGCTTSGSRAGQGPTSGGHVPPGVQGVLPEGDS